MVDFDEALTILENPTRRQILRKLVKEPHYSLQISELLDVSQQAVVKHLKVLEEAGFVDSEKVPSEKGDANFSQTCHFIADLGETKYQPTSINQIT